MAGNDKRVKVKPQSAMVKPEPAQTKPLPVIPQLADYQPTTPAKRDSNMATEKTRLTRPAKCPWDVSSKAMEPAVVNLPESVHADIDAIQAALQSDPEVLANGYTINKGATSRAIFLAGIKALASEKGVDLAGNREATSAAFDKFYSENGPAVDAWRKARAAKIAGA